MTKVQRVRRLFVGFFSVFLLFTLLACTMSADYTATDLLYELIATLDETPSMNIYFKGGEGVNEVCGDELATLFCGSDPGELSSDYAFFMSKDDRPYEIFVFYASSADIRGRLETTLQNRADMMKTREILLYDEEWYENVIVRSMVIVRGRYVFLLITPSNDVLIKKIDKLL